MQDEKNNQQDQQQEPNASQSATATVRLVEGQVWRKAGPYDWLRVTDIMLPGSPKDDGGLPGVSFDALGRNGRGKKDMGWFVPGRDQETIIDWLCNTGRFLQA